MDGSVLETINSPEDLRRLDSRDLERLCGELRAFLIETVSKTGGHLSSNLGVIELTVALHRCLRSPRDVLLFDVGHQCYTHKLLTGRRKGFETLRMKGGVSGFPSPEESAHDIMPAGHASVSVSAAVGLARAKKLRGEPGLVVAVIGDGALTGGMAYEGINNVVGLDNLVIVLNDNNMAISRNVGALAQYLTRLRTSPKYYRAKREVKAMLGSAPVIGDDIVRNIRRMKTVLRKSLYHSTFFEEMGLRYVGPIDGHNITALCNVFANMGRMPRPLLLHVETVKGKGFYPAEQNPGAFHGVGVFDANNITDPDIAPKDSFSTVFGKELAKLGAENHNICAITAAMKYGTGLQYFKKSHPSRFFDVGMAEEHAVTFAGGLAAGGALPVVAIYSTFLQRAYDQILHDVALGGQNVLFAVDRAGLVPDDGAAHQGIYDAAFLSQQAGMRIISPSNYAELVYWLPRLLRDFGGPRAIRYPRGTEPESLAKMPCTGRTYDVLRGRKKNSGTAIVTYGVQTAQALRAQALLKEQSISVDVYKIVQIYPLSDELITGLLGYGQILFAEEGVRRGGIGEHAAALLAEAGFTGRFHLQAIPGAAVGPATRAQLLCDFGLDGDSLAARVRACGEGA